MYVLFLFFDVLVFRTSLSHSGVGFFSFSFQLGIADRLSDPSEVMMDLYGRVIIEAVQLASFFLAATVGCCLVPCIVVWTSREFCVIGLVEVDE